MQTRVNIHIESDESGDILDNTTITLHTNPLTSKIMTRALVEYMFNIYYDYKTSHIMPGYAQVINQHRGNAMAEFMHLIMLSLTDEITPTDMAQITYGCETGANKQEHREKLELIISNLAKRRIIRVSTTDFCQHGETIDVRWRSPRVPMPTSVEYRCDEECWKLWWQAFFCALERCIKRAQEQFIKHGVNIQYNELAPQINEEELAAFLAQ